MYNISKIANGNFVPQPSLLIPNSSLKIPNSSLILSAALNLSLASYVYRQHIRSDAVRAVGREAHRRALAPHAQLG